MIRSKRQLMAKRPESKLDKIRAHYFEGRKLPGRLEEMRLRYEKANALLCEFHSRDQVVKILSQQLGLCSAQCYTIVRDAIELFGDVTKSSKDGLKHILTEHLMVVLREARDEKDYLAMNRAIENIAKLNGLFDNTALPFDPKSLLMPVQINFTTDAGILKQQVEDAEAEEL